MAKEKYISTPEERANSKAIWLKGNRPMTNIELKEYLSSSYGNALVRGIERDKYWARIEVVGIDGEPKEIIISLPTKQVSQYT